MPNGKIQPEFVDRLHQMGEWLRINGESIYATRGGYIRPQSWGCLTQKDDKIFVHVLDDGASNITLEQFLIKKSAKLI